MAVAADVDNLTDQEVLALHYDWDTWARPNQRFPTGDWVTWILMAGRGYGKTRVGAEKVRDWALRFPRCRIAIISPTTADTRDVAVEGESGILAISPPWFKPIYEPSKRRVTWPNGSKAFLYSAEEPERLRGPQHHFAWTDELGAWQYPQDTWDMMQFGLRLGRHPQAVITTTPRPIPLLRTFLKQYHQGDPEIILTTGTTYENKDNLARSFYKQVAKYEGTRLGRQELHAEMIDPEESGIVQKSWLKLYPANTPLPRFQFIVQSYDTAYTEKTLDRKSKEPDPTAQTTWGVFEQRIDRPNRPPQFVSSVMLLDAWADHLKYPTLRDKLITDFDIQYNDRGVDLIIIEDKGSGISLRQDLPPDLPVHPYNPGKADKTARLHYVSHFPAHGLVYIPESKLNPGAPISWAEPFIEQLSCFPDVEHDDYVDTFSQALKYLGDVGYLTVDPLIELPPELIEPTSRAAGRQGNPYLVS